MTRKGFFIIGSLAVLALLLAVAPASSIVGEHDAAAAGNIIYVDADAMGTDDGTSWANAFTDLQDALAMAEAGDQIWVVEGIYKPTDGTDRAISFQMKNSVGIYGGFAGTESSAEQRDWEAQETILSGDLNGDDGPDFANNDENSYHVFRHSGGLDGTAILDGFTIAGGNANGDGFQGEGGGMYNEYGSSPTLANCTFSANSATSRGGGLCNDLSRPELTNCTFVGNSAGLGGGMSNDGSSPLLANCTFSSNSAGLGGGMENFWYSSPTLTNCTFSSNSAEAGGAMYNHDYNSSPILTNSILWGNTPNQMLSDSSSSPVVTYSDVQGGYPGEGNIDADPLFADPDNGDIHLGPGSPCIDAGDNDAPDLPPYDFEGDDRIIDGDGDETATVDMGVDEATLADSGTLNLTVSLQGRTDHSGGLFTAWSGGEEAGSCESDSAGACSINLPAGVYSVTVEMASYLDSVWDSVSVSEGESVALPTVVLLGGDTNDDCVINIQDLAFMGYRFNACVGDPLYDVRGDINADGCINILDLAMAGSNFNQTCPVPW